MLKVSERTELRRIINARFDLLKSELSTRQILIKDAIEHEVLERHKKELAEAKKELAVLNKKAIALAAEFAKWDQELHDKGLMTYRRYSYMVPERLEIENIHSLVGEEMRRLKLDISMHKAFASLDNRRLDLLEELALTGLETEQAREFFKSIPTVDDLVPLPPNMKKAIEARADGG